MFVEHTIKKKEEFMYQLPILPYNSQDFEPFIDTHTMGLHYHKHQQTYLDNLEKVLDFTSANNIYNRKK